MGDAHVDASGHEDRGNDDEEVLQDKPDDRIRVLLRRERAEDVTQDFQDASQREWGEGPRPEAQHLKHVQDAACCEPGNC